LSKNFALTEQNGGHRLITMTVEWRGMSHQNERLELEMKMMRAPAIGAPK
jgi:hypothetical protein